MFCCKGLQFHTSSFSGVTAGGGTEPSTISSLVNTQGAASMNFDFTVTDDANTSGGNDALPTLISQIVITQGSGNDISTWTDAIQGAELTDGTNSTTGTVTGSTIVFSGINTATLGNVADGTSKTYQLKVWLKTTLGGSLPTTVDGLNLSFRVDRTNFTTASSASSTQMETGGGTAVVSGGSANAIQVVATALQFVQQPSTTSQHASMSPAVTIAAVDANGNRDLNYTSSVSVTSTGTLTGSPVSVAAAAGLATFSSLTHTVVGINYSLTGSSSGLSNTPLSSLFNISAVLPEINVQGNGVTIVDGDATPSLADHTDFGNVSLGGTMTRTFTIQNTGTASLSLTGASPFVTISGANASHFSITSIPSSSIGAGSSTTFVVTYTPPVLGESIATITISNNDSDEATYDFAIKGTAVVTPPITYAAGDFRPLYATSLSNNGQWEYFDGSSWTAVPDNKAPQNTTTTINRVFINTYVSGGGSATKAYNCDFIIQEGGELDITDDLTTPTAEMLAANKKIEVLSGGILKIRGDIDVASTASIIVRQGGEMIIDQASMNNAHKMWDGVELFEGGSTVTLKNWNWTISATTRSLVNISTAISSNANGYKFGNFVFDATPTETWTLVGGPVGIINLCENNLEIRNASSNFIGGTTNSTGTNGFLVNGDMIIHDGPFSFGSSFSNSAFSHVFTINGEFKCLSNDLLKIHHIGLNTPTNLTGYVNFKGNVTIANTVSGFTNDKSGANTRMYVNFDGGTEMEPLFVEIHPTAVAIAMNVKPSAFVRLRNTDLLVNAATGETTAFTVETDGSLHFSWGADNLTPLNIKKTSTSPVGTNSFISKVGSDLYISSLHGITNAYPLGNVQTNVRTYESMADFHYIGKTSQHSGNGLPVDIRNLTIFNSGAVGSNHVYLNNFAKNVHNTLSMKTGNIITNVDTIIILGSSTSTLGTLDYHSGFVIGRMRRWFNGTNSGIASGLFPMGVTLSEPLNRHSLIEFTSAPSSGGHLTVEFMEVNMGLAGLTIPQANAGGAPFDVETTEDQGYWKIDNEPTKLVDGAYRIACTGEGFITITDLTQLTLLKRVGGGDWFCPGNHEVPTGTIEMPTVARNSVSNWSNFGFGAPSINPLPVQLMAFEGICKDGRNLISWKTASEQNTQEFILESSSNLETWNTISTQQAAGNSSVENEYSFVHASGGNSFYYRLVQTDLDGSISTSETIFVACSSNDSWSIHPNPANEFVVVQHGGSHGNFSLLMTTSDGKIIEQTTMDSKVTSSKIVYTQYLASGVYYVSIMNENSGERITEKLVISH
jgi:hypothetical protein